MPKSNLENAIKKATSKDTVRSTPHPPPSAPHSPRPKPDPTPVTLNTHDPNRPSSKLCGLESLAAKADPEGACRQYSAALLAASLGPDTRA